MRSKVRSCRDGKPHRSVWLVVQPDSDVALGFVVLQGPPVAFVPRMDGAARLAHRIAKNPELAAKAPAVDLRNSGIRVGQEPIGNELWSSTFWQVDRNGKLKRDKARGCVAGCLTVAMRNTRPYLTFTYTCYPVDPPKLKGQRLGVRPRSRR